MVLRRAEGVWCSLHRYWYSASSTINSPFPSWSPCKVEVELKHDETKRSISACVDAPGSDDPEMLALTAENKNTAENDETEETEKCKPPLDKKYHDDNVI